MFTFGVDSFIWAEVFSERDLWIIPKSRALGFETLDIAIAHPETFPTEKVRRAVTEAGRRVVTTTTLNKETNLISPDPVVRARGVSSLKTLVDINYELGSTILGGVNYAGWGCITGKPRRDVGTGNTKVHLDCFHMTHEESSFRGAVETCGADYLGSVHVCESNKGIPEVEKDG